MAADPFWDDPIFASLPKQAVAKVELGDAQAHNVGDDPPKLTSWDDFWSDPVFEKLTARRERLPPGKQREFWKYELDESVSIASLFPSLSETTLGQISFRKSAVEYWSKPIGKESAGLYLRTEIDFNGALDEIFQTFRHFLGNQAKPVLRCSAHLGMELRPDNQYAANGLDLMGELMGLQAPLPPVLNLVTIHSVGVRLNVGGPSAGQSVSIVETRQAPPDPLRFTVFGTLTIQIPGLTGSLLLDYRSILGEDSLELVMTIPGEGRWDNALGAESLHLDNVIFRAQIPLDSTHKDGTQSTTVAVQDQEIPPSADSNALATSNVSVSVSARWSSSRGSSIGLSGVFVKGRPDLSYLEGHMANVTWSDIEQLFQDMHGQELQTTEHEITCEGLTVRISQAQITLSGILTINGRRLFEGRIAITKAGLAISAKVSQWEIDDGFIVVQDASLTLLIGKAAHPNSAPGTAKGWMGGLEVTGTVLVNGSAAQKGHDPIKIEATLAIGKQAGSWYWVVCGHMTSDISLSNFVSAIDKDSEIDFRLRSITLVASNVDSPACSISTNNYLIRKGFFLWSELDQIPLLQLGDKVASPAAGDKTYLSVGWQSGSPIPSVSILLPQSLEIQLGPRFRSTRLQLELRHSNTAGVEFAFKGTFLVKVDEERDALEFALDAAVDAVGADGELFFRGDIENPFGLSQELTIGPTLGLGIKFNWTQLATTGLPMGAGFKGSFYLNKQRDDPYSMALYVCENPRDMLIEVKAPRMDYTKIVELVAAAMERQIPTSDMKILEFRDVLIYGSLGATFGGENYPAGFRLKGILTVCDHEAGMDCSLTTEGLKVKAWLPTFELGPLKIGGNAVIPGKAGTYAMLDMEMSLERQAIFLDGYLELFAFQAAVTLKMQLMPTPIFYFDVVLRWSDLISFKAHAEMKHRNPSQPDVRTADWILAAEFESRIVQEIANSLQVALRKFHEAAQQKLDGAKAAVAKAEEDYKRGIEEAQAKLNACRAEFKVASDDMDRQIAELDRRTNEGLQEKFQSLDEQRKQQTISVEQKRLARDQKLQEGRNDVNQKQQNVQDTTSRGQRENNDAVSERERSKQEFMSKFGDAEAALQRAKDSVNSAEGVCSDFDREIAGLENQYRGLAWYQKALALDIHFQIGALEVQRAGARIGLTIANGVLSGILTTMQSDLFRSLKDVFYRAAEVVETVKSKVNLAIQQAQDQLQNARLLLQAAEAALNGDFATAERKAAEMVRNAQKSYDDYKARQDLESEKLRLQLRQLSNSAVGTALTAAEGALELAKNNNIAFQAAQAGLDAVKNIESAVYDQLTALISLAAGLCDIRVMRLAGVLTADPARKSAFKVHMEGVLVGQDFVFDVDFIPGETKDFVIAVTKEAFAFLRLT